MDPRTTGALSDELIVESEANGTAAALVLEDFLPYRLSVLSNTVSYGIEQLYKERFGLTVPECGRWRCSAGSRR